MKLSYLVRLEASKKDCVILKEDAFWDLVKKACDEEGQQILRRSIEKVRKGVQAEVRRKL